MNKLLILYSNDIHGRFGRMPRIATAFRRAKEANPDYAPLTLDIGDHMDRGRIPTEGTKGLANVAVMNATGYDAVTLGNNEGLTFTPQILAGLYGEHARFKVICGNVFETATGEPPPYILPYQIVERGGLRVGLIGVTAASNYLSMLYGLYGWDVREPLPEVRRLVETLRSQTDVIIVMSHLGLVSDQRMAETIPGIDIIFGGHTHHLFEVPHKIGDTYLCATGQYAQYAGVLKLDYDPEERRILSVGGKCVKTNEMLPDPEVGAVMEHYRGLGVQAVSETVVEVERPLENSWYEEASLGNLLAAGLRKWADSEIGLVNAGQLMESLPAGPISRQQLIEVCPSLIHPCRALVQGSGILHALEESLLEENVKKKVGGFGNRGKLLGVLLIDGMTVRYDPSRPDYSKIAEVFVGGELLQPEREYAVGMISYFAAGRVFNTLAQGREIKYFVPTILRDVLIKELRTGDFGDIDEPRWVRI